MKKIVFLLLLLAMFGSFKTGCVRQAEAANVMIQHDYSFTVIADWVIANQKPANGATNVALNTPIEVDILHTLPIVDIAMTVKQNGVVVTGTQVITTITGGKHIKWTPTSNWAMLSNIIYSAIVTLDNGL